MTTIAVKNGIMAYDSRISDGDSHIGFMNKGRKTGKYLIATCGSVEEGEMFMDWLAAGGADADKKLYGLDKDLGNFTALCVNKKGETIFYEHRLYPYSIDAPFYAIGSGSAYALGAMAAGKSAAEAVRIAAQFDLATGGTVRTLSWGKK